MFKCLKYIFFCFVKIIRAKSSCTRLTPGTVLMVQGWNLVPGIKTGLVKHFTSSFPFPPSHYIKHCKKTKNKKTTTLELFQSKNVTISAGFCVLRDVISWKEIRNDLFYWLVNSVTFQTEPGNFFPLTLRLLLPYFLLKCRILAPKWMNSLSQFHTISSYHWILFAFVTEFPTSEYLNFYTCFSILLWL